MKAKEHYHRNTVIFLYFQFPGVILWSSYLQEKLTKTTWVCYTSSKIWMKRMACEWVLGWPETSCTERFLYRILALVTFRRWLGIKQWLIGLHLVPLTPTANWATFVMKTLPVWSLQAINHQINTYINACCQQIIVDLPRSICAR